ncbi:hypothetical protein SNOG_13971 [Paecilomyces variotii No. 5]|uniref:SnoaL-like domain-containing protein n=1 Tax=Byssochlamys spectabilis (strain No. 5 / NBRC 109023) TaxID=1356009 RepID=V5FM19_BYSSN|nr:hypothetical protein SNOG_13971 [Paecilomyces variotii No. 5]
MWKQQQTTPNKRRETAEKFISIFGTLDTQLLDSLLAEDFVHQFAPASLGLREPLGKQVFLEHIGGIREIMVGFPVTANEYIENESGNQVTVWATSLANFREDVKDDGVSEKEWAYEGEYMFLVFMNETGEKITRVIEFLDSKATDEKLRPLIRRARENRQKRLSAESK